MNRLMNESLEAGRIYRSTGAIRRRLLRPNIYRAWERSHQQGADPRAMKAERLSSLETAQLLAQKQNLIENVRPYSQILSQAAGNQRHAVMLSESNAIVLDVVADEQTLNPAAGFPNAGSLLSEAVAGANGIGTSLSEGSYTEIVASEHFIEGFYAFSCQGVPLRNEKQEIIGILSISSRSPTAMPNLKEILLCASAGIEAQLILANLQTTLEQVLRSSPEDYQILEKLQQDIVQAHHSARLRLDLTSRLVANNRIDYAKQILQQAEQSINIFRFRSQFWQQLALPQQDEIQSFSLQKTITNLVDLLSTEITIRKIEVFIPYIDENIQVIGRYKTLLRQLFRYFLQSFEKAGEGGRIHLEIKENFPQSQVTITFIIEPGNSQLPLKPVSYTLLFPITPKKYERSIYFA